MALTEVALKQAAEAGDGLCLDCGAVQEFQERDNARFGLCDECEEQRVIRLEDVWAALVILDWSLA